MIKINLTNTYCNVSGNLRELTKLRDQLKFRHPNAWFLRQHMPKGWDGYVYDISERGTIKVGLIPKLIRKCLELGIEYFIVDNRKLKKLKGIPKRVGKIKILKNSSTVCYLRPDMYMKNMTKRITIQRNKIYFNSYNQQFDPIGLAFGSNLFTALVTPGCSFEL